jgi:thymidylate synthase
MSINYINIYKNSNLDINESEIYHHILNNISDEHSKDHNNYIIISSQMYNDLSFSKDLIENRICIINNGNNEANITNKQPFLNWIKEENLNQIIRDLISEKKNVCVIGEIYVFNQFKDHFDNIYIAEMIEENDPYKTSVTPPSFKYTLRDYSQPLLCKLLTYRLLKYVKCSSFIKDVNHHDEIYKSLVNRTLNTGIKKTDRTGTGTLSTFGNMIEFDISQSIPILTTKRIYWKSVINELLWFMRGDTDANILKKQGVNIWNANSSKSALENIGIHHLAEGDCGANYSFQWRHFGADYKTSGDNYEGQGIDQIKFIENLLKTDKHSRRIFLSAWNPNDLNKTVLPPCHVSCQFYVDNDDNLSCHMYQRSCDLFLGLPFNILSYAILTNLLAKRCNMKASRLCISIGDTHVYNDHLQQIYEQFKRTSLCMPRLLISDSVIKKDIKELALNDFNIIGYFCHPIMSV